MTTRNEPCPCGSGNRYKNCCGDTTAAPLPAWALLGRALALQRAGRLAAAEALYPQVLATDPDEPNALDMPGVICYSDVRYREGLHYALRAAHLTRWQVPQVLHNLGLLCGRLLAARANLRRAELLAAHLRFVRASGNRSAEAWQVESVSPVSSVSISPNEKSVTTSADDTEDAEIF